MHIKKYVRGKDWKFKNHLIAIIAIGGKLRGGQIPELAELGLILDHWIRGFFYINWSFQSSLPLSLTCNMKWPTRVLENLFDMDLCGQNIPKLILWSLQSC